MAEKRNPAGWWRYTEQKWHYSDAGNIWPLCGISPAYDETRQAAREDGGTPETRCKTCQKRLAQEAGAGKG